MSTPPRPSNTGSAEPKKAAVALQASVDENGNSVIDLVTTAADATASTTSTQDGPPPAQRMRMSTGTTGPSVRRTMERLNRVSPVRDFDAVNPYDRFGARRRLRREDRELRKAEREKARAKEKAQRRQDRMAIRSMQQAPQPANVTNEQWENYRSHLRDAEARLDEMGCSSSDDSACPIQAAGRSLMEALDPFGRPGSRRPAPVTQEEQDCPIQAAGRRLMEAVGNPLGLQARHRPGHRAGTRHPAPVTQEEQDVDLVAEFDRAEGVTQAPPPRQRARAAQELADLTNHLLRERSAEVPNGVLTPEVVQEIVKEGIEIFHKQSKSPTPKPQDDEQGPTVQELHLNLRPDPSGNGYIFNPADTNMPDAPAAAQQQAEQQPAVTLGPMVPLNELASTQLPRQLKTKIGTGTVLKANVIRPADYWRYPEADHDEEDPEQLASNQIKYDRHSDYPRGKSASKTGARKGDAKAFPEIHSLTAGKVRLGLSKYEEFLDLYSPISAYFRMEMYRLIHEFGYVRAMRKNNRAGFDLFVREVAELTRVLPEGVRRAMLATFGVDDDELWTQDSRFFMHAWESLVVHVADGVLSSIEAGRRAIRERDAAEGPQVLGATPALQRWYNSANTNLPLPVEDFAHPGAPDIDPATGHPFGALDENGRPYPRKSTKKGKGGAEEEAGGDDV